MSDKKKKPLAACIRSWMKRTTLPFNLRPTVMTMLLFSGNITEESETAIIKFASQKQIAEIRGVSDRQIRRDLTWLEFLGFVSWKRRQRPQPAIYVLRCQPDPTVNLQLIDRKNTVDEIESGHICPVKNESRADMHVLSQKSQTGHVGFQTGHIGFSDRTSTFSDPTENLPSTLENPDQNVRSGVNDDRFVSGSHIGPQQRPLAFKSKTGEAAPAAKKQNNQTNGEELGALEPEVGPSLPKARTKTRTVHLSDEPCEGCFARRYQPHHKNCMLVSTDAVLGLGE